MDPVPIDWVAVEDWLGLSLPGDYKAVATAYGPLDIGDHIWLHTPCIQKGRFEYSKWLSETHRRCRLASRKASPLDPPPFHPAPGGLLAWGETRRAHVLFWDTSPSDDPDEWRTAIFDQNAASAHMNPWTYLDMPMLAALDTAITSGIEIPRAPSIGPLPATGRRTAFLPDPEPWTPPTPAPRGTSQTRRRAALTQGTGFDALTALIPPPAAPYLGEGSWDDLFDRLGTRLPTGYTSLMTRYGAGVWRGWLRFQTPLRIAGRGLVYHSAESLDIYRSLRSEFPEFHPLRAWPERGGFLPFASSIEGDDLAWLTVGDPDTWPLIVVPRDGDQDPPLQSGLIETLLTWARGNHVTHGLPGLDPLDDPLEFATFTPWDDKSHW
ncbi:hypothetical protein GCM10009858_04010 [Terrabacter carboxydivorans]|uniref:Knr4/Smi1-like domain-containing protein n=2 Tax=Terrabacter carboxydivorans TaxID=619730 RepID=A0ABP5XYW1_9MICO